MFYRRQRRRSVTNSALLRCSNIKTALFELRMLAVGDLVHTVYGVHNHRTVTA